MTRAQALVRRPITWLLAAALATGILTFRDFGLTWDEPLFYAYGNALGYAYTPANWLAPDFDLTQSYGPSADDHKTRGPGYLVIARIPTAALRALGLEEAAAWHLVNLLTFLVGVYFVYKLGTWVAGEMGATFGAALFASQPLLWGHAFINPKDMPFLVLFAASVWTGVAAVDRLTQHPAANAGRRLRDLAVAAILLGLASSNRVLGPLAGLFVAIYLLSRQASWRTAAWLAAYGAVATIIMYITWPYLWEDPLRFFEVFGLMAQNPTVLRVLFQDVVYHADALPLRYLPVYLVVTLTEPVWPLFAAGLGRLVTARGGIIDQSRVLVLMGWFGIPMIYVLMARPPMYDGMRHFLFVLPPVFALTAAGVQWIFEHIRPMWFRSALAVALLLPGLVGIFRLHPYEYTYFNSLIGGTAGAFRRYETDYWLTCYKESIEKLAAMRSSPTRVFVQREPAVAAPYAESGMTIMDARGASNEIRKGDYVLVSTRTNEDLRVFRDAPEALSIGRAGAVFCVVKAPE